MQGWHLQRTEVPGSCLRQRYQGIYVLSILLPSFGQMGLISLGLFTSIQSPLGNMPVPETVI